VYESERFRVKVDVRRKAAACEADFVGIFTNTGVFARNGRILSSQPAVKLRTDTRR
jgi:hypothetical protein